MRQIRTAAMTFRPDTAFWLAFSLSFIAFGLCTWSWSAYLTDRNAAPAITLSDRQTFRADFTTLVTQEVDEAYVNARASADQMASLLVGNMSRRAREDFTPWMVDFGQSFDRSPASTTEQFLTPASVKASSYVALVEDKFVQSVSSREHFNLMASYIQIRAMESFRAEARSRLHSLQRFLNADLAGLATPGDAATEISINGAAESEFSESDDLAWANGLIEESLAALEETASGGSSFGSEAYSRMFDAALLESMRTIVSDASHGDRSQAGVFIESMSGDAELITSGAALAVTWFASRLPSDREDARTLFAQLLDDHFQYLLSGLQGQHGAGVMSLAQEKHDSVIRKLANS